MSGLLALAVLALPLSQEPGGPHPDGATGGTPAAAARSAADALGADLRKACAEAADAGLVWLAGRQARSGAWTGMVGHKQQDGYVELDIGLPLHAQRSTGRGHVGVTALCGMAFLAGGHLPDRGGHGAAVQRTVDYLLEHALENGLLTDSGTRMYSHAFATLFLAEVYGMSGGQAVKDALERAVNLIVDSQNRHGGWRYNPFDQELDLSVTVCQLQSLRAARNIGIDVPDDTVQRAVDYVLASQVDAPRVAGNPGGRGGRGRGRRPGFGGGQFYYKIHGPGAYDKPDEFAINAAALTALASAGIYDPALHDPTLDFLERAYGDVADYRGDHFYFWYGNYYACQAFFQTGGPRFRTYYERLAADLLRMQRHDGSWHNRVGPGDEFSTAVACLLLQLPRQYLPIFQR